MKRLWAFVETDTGRLLLGFVLTTVVGGALITFYQQQNWEKQQQLEVTRETMQWQRDRRFEMLRRRLDNGEKALEQIADVMDTRSYRLRNVFAAVVGEDHSRIAPAWRDYMASVDTWNATIASNRSRLARLVSPEAANELNNYETDNNDIANPKSIHGQFFLAHRRIDKLVRCVNAPPCAPSAIDRHETAELINQINLHADDFVERMTAQFLNAASSLQGSSTPGN
ncbi:MAG TPA: hypothetical protein VGJ82_13355 [Thermoanaerobaculia bacterium]|jgi:hypothetical protein